MAAPYFYRSDIEVRSRGAESVLIVKGAGPSRSVAFPFPGIYALMGPNQIGKSVLIKTLMSVGLPGLSSTASSHLHLAGRMFNATRLVDVLRAGVITVFQDDQLIPSMTIREQILMRHAMPQSQHWFYLALERSGVSGVLDWARTVIGFDGKLLIADSPPLQPESEVNSRSEAWVSRFGYDGILDKLPRELSGGARAAARIVQAMVSRQVAVLMLDEALANIEARAIVRIIDVLRSWRAESGSAILVVTHSREELVHWSPHQILELEQGEVVARDTRRHSHLVTGIPTRNQAVPIFERERGDEFPSGLLSSSKVIVLADARVQNTEPYVQMMNLIRINSRAQVEIVVDAGEANKSTNQAARLTRSVLDVITGSDTTIVVAGGGTVLNVGGFVAAVVYRGKFPTVLVPTTVMAIADVGVGSKTGVNATYSGRMLKHAVGVYFNPAAVWLDDRYLVSLPDEQIIAGLSEVLKHGLLQDRGLFERCVAIMNAPSVDRVQAYRAALSAMQLKAGVLAADPFEERQGKLLMYGHLHAHSFERATTPPIEHGLSVLLGILIELRLAGEVSIYQAVLAAVSRWVKALWAGRSWPGRDELMSGYRLDMNANPGLHRAAIVDAIGCYGDELTAKEPESKRVSVEEIALAVELVRRDLAL